MDNTLERTLISPERALSLYESLLVQTGWMIPGVAPYDPLLWSQSRRQLATHRLGVVMRLKVRGMVRRYGPGDILSPDDLGILEDILDLYEWFKHCDLRGPQ